MRIAVLLFPAIRMGCESPTDHQARDMQEVFESDRETEEVRMRFRKKYTEVEAREFLTNNDDGSHLDELVSWIGAKARHDNIYLYIHTLQGETKAEVGDWIINDSYPPDGRKFYPCKRVVFENTYEPVAQNQTMKPGGYYKGRIVEEVRNWLYWKFTGWPFKQRRP